MQLYKLPKMVAGYRWVGVAGLRLKRPPKIDKVLHLLNSVSTRNDTPIQVIDAKYLCGPRHVYHATSLALKAYDEKRTRAKRLEMELLLYLSGRRQIGDAIDSLGLKAGTKEAAVIAIGSTERSVSTALGDAEELLDGEEGDLILEVNGSKRKEIQRVFEISDEELEVVNRGKGWEEDLLKLVLERGAMLDAIKK